jgi:hypothetical protein
MNLTKFLWMLQQNALYFCRSDFLGDPYEGYYTEGTANSQEAFVAGFIKQTAFENSETNREKARRGFKMMLEGAREIRQELFVNCWHMNDTESAAMWKLYTSNDEAICVKSTFKKLAMALLPNCFCGAVTYINFKADIIDPGNSLNFIMHKRLSYAHEREIRAVMWLKSQDQGPYPKISEKGVTVPVDFSFLDEVYVSPSSTDTFRQIIEALVRKYGLNLPVLQSSVNAPPAY